MTKETWKGITILKADDGAYITNEETYSTKVYLGKESSESEWRDASAEEYEAWLNFEPITEEEALVRYANELTGAEDETLTEATETLIKQLKEGN